MRHVEIVIVVLTFLGGIAREGKEGLPEGRACFADKAVGKMQVRLT